MSPDGETPAGLARLLDVAEIAPGVFHGAYVAGAEGRVYGGQVLAQALMAAVRAMDTSRIAHAMHCQFIRLGADDQPIEYRVAREFEGRAFALARVTAHQGADLLFTASISFQRPEEGLVHQAPMPETPPPEDLPPLDDALRLIKPGNRTPRIFDPDWPVELRFVEGNAIVSDKPGAPRLGIWFRARARLGEDENLHRAAIAYCSDMGLLATALRPHAIPLGAAMLQRASLDHALWLHEPARADEWLLFTMESPWAGHARGFNRGIIYARDGRLVASAAQEALIRVRG